MPPRSARLVDVPSLQPPVLSEPLPDPEGSGGIDNASYVSPILVQFAGRRLLIGCSLRHLYCADADTGRLQWVRRRPTSYSVLAMMPVLVGDAVFMAAPHGPPGRLHRLLAPAAPDAPVGRIQAALQKATRLKPVHQPGDGDRLHLDQGGQYILGDAGPALQPDQNDPLGAGHAHLTRMLIGAHPHEARHVIEQKEEIVVERLLHHVTFTQDMIT